MNRQLKITGYIGLLASLAMFAGDMLLYFTLQPFGNFEQELLPSMGCVPFGRLVAGGIIGPLSACLYIAGFSHLYFAVKKPRKRIAQLMLGVFIASMMAGGAFHAFFPAFGIVASEGHPGMIESLSKYAAYLQGIMFFLMLAGWSAFIYLVLRKQTLYPRLTVAATPLVSIWLIFLWQYLPQPFLIVIAGGWSNLVMTLFFAISLIILGRKKELKTSDFGHPA